MDVYPFAVPRFRRFMILKKTSGCLERNLWLKYMNNTENPDIIRKLMTPLLL